MKLPLGIITLVKTKDGVLWDIVDGQQRLTFLTLLGAYINDESWRNFIYSNAKELRIQFTGRPEDTEDIANITAQKYDEVKNPNFRMFLDCVRSEKIKDGIFSEFSRYIYEKASFLISELPGTYEPVALNRFFEKMNAAGRQLTPIEQIKGKYFPSHAEEFDACLNFEERFADPKENAQNDTTKENTLQAILDDKSTPATPEPLENSSVDRYANRSILRPAVFLLHVLRLLKNDSNSNISLNENKLLDIFSKNKPEAQEFIEKMKAYRKWMDDNIIYQKILDNDAIEYTFRPQNNVSETEDKDDEKNKIKIMLRQYQSMLFVSSSNAQEWVLTAYQKANCEVLALDRLKELDNRPLPDLKSMRYLSIDRYWFWKLDYLLWEEAFCNADEFIKAYKISEDEQKAIENYRFRPNRSIEHLHPQTDNGAAEWETVKDSFGNLAMISSSFNSMQSNDSIGIKFARVKDNQIPAQKLESIKMLLMFRLAEGLESKWTTDIAEKHGREMHDLLKNNKVSYDEKF